MVARQDVDQRIPERIFSWIWKMGMIFNEFDLDNDNDNDMHEVVAASLRQCDVTHRM